MFESLQLTSSVALDVGAEVESGASQFPDLWGKYEYLKPIDGFAEASRDVVDERRIALEELYLLFQEHRRVSDDIGMAEYLLSFILWIGEIEAVPYLINALTSTDEHLKGHILWILEGNCNSNSLNALRQYLQRETNPSYIGQALIVISFIKEKEAIPTLTEWLDSDTVLADGQTLSQVAKEQLERIRGSLHVR